MTHTIYHNKLVRDHILELLQERGISCSHEVLEGDAYIKALRHKLQEEVTEYLTAGSTEHRHEELADILEVLHALAKEDGLSLSLLEKKRHDKAEVRGGFASRLFLKTTESSKKSNENPSCLFCSIGKGEIPGEIIARFTHCYVLCDQYPVTKSHLLFIPYEHTENWFTASETVRYDIMQAIDQMKKRFEAEYKPDGYNIGMNCGTAAGQSMMHLHVHLIPRYKGDVADPLGGVRGVIPAKQNYKTPLCCNGDTVGAG